MKKARIGWVDYTTGQEGSGRSAIDVAHAEQWVEAMSKLYPNMLHYLINADQEEEPAEEEQA